MEHQNIGKFIKELRTEKNLSQNQLAEIIPITRQAISKWERNETIPDSFTLLKLSEIFDVTINELLQGKRIEKPSIEELENTTLNIIDDSNKKIIKHKLRFVYSIIIICLLIIGFLFYYFINSYNSIKVYTINQDDGQFTVSDGLLILTKQQVYLKLGSLKTPANTVINNLKLVYKTNQKELTLIEDKDLDKLLIRDYTGYNSFIINIKEKSLINYLYLYITYNESEEQILKLNLKRDFVNNSILFNESRQNVNEQDIIIENNFDSYEIIEKLKEKGIETTNNITIEKDDITIIYNKNNNNLDMYIKEIINWNYNLTYKTHNCFNENIKEDCIAIIKNDINNYVLN